MKEIFISDKKRKDGLSFLFSNRNNSNRKKMIKSVIYNEANIANTARNIRPKKKIRFSSNEEKINLKRKINFEVYCSSNNSQDPE